MTYYKKKKSNKKKMIEKPNIGQDGLDWNLLRNPFEAPPSATSNSDLSFMFNERKYYRDGVFREFFLRETNLIDYWNVVNKYGTVDEKGFSIYCPDSQLRDVLSTPTPEDDVRAIDFVADAFDHMVDTYNSKASKGAVDIVNESLLWPLEAKRGWASAKEQYNDYMQAYFDVLVNNFIKGLPPSKSMKIKDFLSFVTEGVIPFFSASHKRYPLTFSSFLASKACKLHASGLVIEISEADAGDDLSKFESFLADVNFETYRQVAKQSGFWIDKNIPWRLIANIKHPKMLQVQARNGILSGVTGNSADLFRESYAVAHREDIAQLQFHLSGFYKALLDRWDTNRYPKTIKNCQGVLKTKTVTYQYEPIDAFYQSGQINPDSSYHENFGPLFWLKIYIFFKNGEKGNLLSEKEVDKEWRSYYSFYKTRGFLATVDEINRRLIDKTFKRTLL